MSKKRILVVEDEADMAELLALRLTREGYEVEAVHDGAEALSRVRARPPDLVLLDIMLPGRPGTEVAAELRADGRTAAIPIIMLTAKSEESDVVVGLKLGADDYVTKPFTMSVLLARVAAVLRRSAAAPGPAKGVLRVGPVTIDPERHRAEVAGKPLTLTLTEFKLLAALAAARGRVLTRNHLIDQAMGPNVVVTDRTIDVHLTALRRKLGKARALLKTIRGVGYSMADEHDESGPIQ